MKGMYAISASVTNVRDGWTGTEHLPMFYLHPVVQGIVSVEHAERVARDLLGPARAGDLVDVHAEFVPS